MGILILGLILATIAMIILAFGLTEQPSAKAKKHKGQPPKQDFVESYAIRRLEEEIASLKAQLDNEKTGHQNTKSQLQLSIDKEAQLRQELERLKNWDNTDNAELEKLKKENAQLRDELLNKGKETEEEFSKNLNLSKEIKEDKEKSSVLEREKRQMIDEARLLNARIEGLQKEIEKQNREIHEMKKKEEQSEWISKREYNELKKALQVKEEELKRLRAGG